jgi:hypothetical protein
MYDRDKWMFIFPTIRQWGGSRFWLVKNEELKEVLGIWVNHVVTHGTG